MQIFQVGEAASYVKELLEADLVLSDLWITGEVTNLTRSGKGHYYFALKDETSQLRSLLFRGNALRCGAEPRAGDAVVAHGRIAFYERNGACEFCVDLLYPGGVGLAQLRFEALRLKLEQEGLFAPERKRPLPEFPRRIGLVTSESGAVLHDVLTILARRYPIAEVVLAHTAVQGDQAPDEIVAALARLAAWRDDDGEGVEVVIVGRGGGSPEELAAFNDERVARALFASPWPVISAVGHETDLTTCDEVADLRAPTPSAAAELVAPDLRLLAQEVADLAAAGRVAIERTLDEAREQLRHAGERLVARSPLTRVALHRQATHTEVERARTALAHQLATARAHLEGRWLQLAALSPGATLARGYSVVNVVGDGVVRSTRDVASGDALEIRVIDGILDATTTGTRATDPGADTDRGPTATGVGATRASRLPSPRAAGGDARVAPSTGGRPRE
jgi:exodeoxyribonuclease VII large subunit